MFYFGFETGPLVDFLSGCSCILESRVVKLLMFLSFVLDLGLESGKHVDFFSYILIVDSRLVHMLTFYQFFLVLWIRERSTC